LHSFQHTIKNVGNTCYFNSVLQVIVSLPSFVSSNEITLQNQDHADNSYYRALLKLFILAIASQTLSPSSALKWSSVMVGDRQMKQEEWINFVYSLTIKFDQLYVTGALSDPGDLLECVISIVPGIAQMCAMDSVWITTPPCSCRMAKKAVLTEERGLTITVSNQQSFIHHVYKIFQSEQVSYYHCDCCWRNSSADHPAMRQRSLRSLLRFLKISITAPLTSAARPPDYHHHGPPRDYEMLDLSELTPQPRRRSMRYTLRAAIMYSKKHHWAYLCSTTPIFVSDHISREATPEDLLMVAHCAQILIYEQDSSPVSLSGGLDGLASGEIVASTSGNKTLIPHAVRIDRFSASQKERPIQRSSAQQDHRENCSTAVITRERLPIKPNDQQKVQHLMSGVPRQRVLGDFFGALLPTVVVHSTVPDSALSVSSTTPPEPPEQNSGLSQGLAAQPLILTDNDSAQPEIPSVISDDPRPPTEAARVPPPNVYAEQVTTSLPIVLRPATLNSTQWIPGTMGLYPRPKGALSPSSADWLKSFPLWKVRVDGLKPQQAMFQIADSLSDS
jgi:hypothetical protein